MREEVLSLRNIYTWDNELTTLKDFNLTIFKGEVVYLTGKYGSGKKTVKELLSGNIGYSGDIRMKGEVIDNFQGNDIYKNGVVCIDNERRLVDHMSLSENVFAVRPKAKWLARYREKLVWEQTKRLLQQVDLVCDPNDKVYTLSPFEKQMLCIAKAISFNVKLIVVDCIRSDYSILDYLRLSRIIENLKQQGLSFLIIGDDNNNILNIVTKIVFLINGTDAKEWDCAERNFINQAEEIRFKIKEKNGMSLAFPPNHRNIWGFYDLSWDSNSDLADYLSKWSEGNAANPKVEEFIKKIAGMNRRKVVINEYTNKQLLPGSIRDNLILPSSKKLSARLGTVNSDLIEYIYQEFMDIFKIEKEITCVEELTSVQKKILTVFRWIYYTPSIVIMENPYIGLGLQDTICLNQCIELLEKQGIWIMILSKTPEDLALCCNQIFCNHSFHLIKVFDYEEYEVLGDELLSLMKNKELFY